MSRSVELAHRAIGALADDKEWKQRLNEASMHLGFINPENRKEDLSEDARELLDLALDGNLPLGERAKHIADAIMVIMRCKPDREN